MRPALRDVGECHYVVAGGGDSEYGPLPSKRLPMQARRFWRRNGLGESTRGIVVFVNKRLVAFFRYSAGFRWLVPGGTWVDRAWRRKGLAQQMWLKALDRHRAQSVEVTTVSRGGSRLIRRLKALRPHIQFLESKSYG